MFEPKNCKAYLGSIRNITEALTSTLDVGEVLRQIVRLTAEATGAKGCALRLLDERTRQLVLSAAWGLSENYLTKGPIDVDHSIAACMKGESVHIQDVKNDPRIQYPKHAEAEGIVSLLSVPMVLMNRVVGVLRLYASESRHYAEEELEFVRTLAGLGTLAIEHARLYSRLKADHESLIKDFHAWFESSLHPHTGPADTAKL
ncbi:MAG: GAF domain-containing protein [Nitrospinota bacterium]